MNVTEVKFITKNNIDIYLSYKDMFDLTLEELMEIEVNVATGEKTLTLRESPGIVTVITEEEIQNSGARDLIDALRLVPGIESGVDVYGTVGLTMRGSSGFDKVLIMLDGQEMNEPGFASTSLGNRFILDQVKRIEIIRGPGSAIYGGTAEFGVINIITKSGEDINGASVGATYGQMRQSANLSLGKKFNEDLEFSLSGYLGQGNRSNGTYSDVYGTSYNMTDSAELKPLNISLGFKYRGLQLRIIRNEHNLTTRDLVDEVALKDYSIKSKKTIGDIKYDLKVWEKLTITPQYTYSYDLPWYG